MIQLLTHIYDTAGGGTWIIILVLIIGIAEVLEAAFKRHN